MERVRYVQLPTRLLTKHEKVTTSHETVREVPSHYLIMGLILATRPLICTEYIIVVVHTSALHCKFREEVALIGILKAKNQNLLLFLVDL